MLKYVNVESGIPIPDPDFRAGKTWLKLTMDIGDSIRVDNRYAGSISSRIRNHQKIYKNEKFTRRTMIDANGEKYIRVWRIA